jgi:hypothetical protein
MSPRMEPHDDEGGEAPCFAHLFADESGVEEAQRSQGTSPRSPGRTTPAS